MEMEDSTGGTESSGTTSEQDGETVNAAQGCRLAVLHLLCEGINLPHPSFAHFLLGFNTQAPLTK